MARLSKALPSFGDNRVSSDLDQDEPWDVDGDGFITFPSGTPMWEEIPDYGDMGPAPAFLRNLPGRALDYRGAASDNSPI